MPLILKRRITPRTAGEPAELYGNVGQPLHRGIYEHTTANGKSIWVAISDGGRVVASLRIPRVRESDPLSEQAWQHLLGKAWIALEIADPFEAAQFVYPDFCSA